MSECLKLIFIISIKVCLDQNFITFFLQSGLNVFFVSVQFSSFPAGLFLTFIQPSAYSVLPMMMMRLLYHPNVVRSFLIMGIIIIIEVFLYSTDHDDGGRNIERKREREQMADVCSKSLIIF